MIKILRRVLATKGAVNIISLSELKLESDVQQENDHQLYGTDMALLRLLQIKESRHSAMNIFGYFQSDGM